MYTREFYAVKIIDPNGTTYYACGAKGHSLTPDSTSPNIEFHSLEDAKKVGDFWAHQFNGKAQNINLVWVTVQAKELEEY